ncbi:hypothetical protein ACHAW5_000316 [Stephanodiscus triporus]|uniref:Uncharacterized protein n=1 Tax=Stephanodiscus triporus TaxID=2934178 RepID=A0ABD3NFB0_9STRA
MPSEEWFADLLVGTFNVQGYLFLEALREKEEEEVVGGGEDGYFGAVGEVRGAYAEEVESGNAGTGDDGDVFSGVATILDNPILTHLHIGIIAGACAIALLLCCCCVRGIKRRRSSSRKFDDEHEVYEKAFPPISTGKAVGRTTTRGMADDAIVPEKKSGTWLGRKRSKDVNPPPSSSSSSSSSSAGRRSTNDRSGASSPGSVTSYIVADPSLDEVETGIQQVMTASSSSSSSIQSPSSSETDDGARPIRRDDGSPMKGLLTQMMMDTSGRERKITVLSAHR